MPQIDQLSEIFSSQLFWLTLIFGAIFFGVARGMLPKVQSVVEERERHIAENQAKADAARLEAERTEAAWRERMDSARAEAIRVLNDAKARSARENEAKVKAAIEDIDRQTDVAMKGIRDAVAAARSGIDEAAADAAREIVLRLVGVKVEKKDAAAAVATELGRAVR